MTTRHQPVLIQYHSKCFPLVVLVLEYVLKAHPFPHRGAWGQWGNPSIPVRDVSASPVVKHPTHTQQLLPNRERVSVYL